MSLMDGKVKIYLLFLFVLVKCTKNDNKTPTKPKCMDFKTPGYTEPQGDIAIRYGEKLEITCSVYGDSEAAAQRWDFGSNPSSKLYFSIGNNNVNFYPNNSYDPLDEGAERVDVVSPTSIKLTIKKPKTRKETFYCYYKNILSGGSTLVCLNLVVVGVPPQKVTDFSCISNNWENMTCSWTPPENYVETNYTVYYNFQDYSSDNLTAPGFPQDDSKHSNMSFTLVNLSDGTFYYRQSREVYQIYLIIKNPFGERVQTIIWNHFENIRTKPPKRLGGKATSPSSIFLNWTISNNLVALPSNITYRIMYKCEKFCKTWKLGGMFTQTHHREKVSYDLKNLDYAHELYDIRVSMKVQTASDKLWSSNSSITLRTESKIPDYPPPTTLGAFQYVTSQPREVYVYFQKIRPEAENGEDFQYDFVIEPSLEMVQATQAYAKFVGLEEGKRYVVRIWSKNQVGRSTLFSEVVIPAQRVKELNKLTKIQHEDSYELHWAAPNTEQIITNYTLFWCDHPTDRPNQCSGNLNWTVVPNNLTKYNISVPPTNKIYQFAISANSIDGSSGMLWASCMLLANGTVGKISESWVNSVGPDFIELKWNIDCAELVSEVTGYIIYYCTTDITYNNTCSSPLRNVSVASNLNSNLQIGRVGNLTPYTTYLLAVSIKTKSTIGLRSEFLRNVTQEAAPSTPPTDINITHITNSSVTLQWKPPAQPNGKIKNNIIYYNDTPVIVGGDLVNYTLTNLESFQLYVISMKACTPTCSKASENQTVKTKMGIPGQTSRPYLDYNNESNSVIRWGEPDPPRGEVNYYQVIITNENNNSSQDINNISAPEFPFDPCGGDMDKYSNSYISVRAVNIIDNEHYLGPLSEPFKMTNCNYNSVIWLLYVFIGISVFLLLVFLSIRAYACCRRMQDVEVKLPAGLAPAIERSEKISDIDRFSEADEELLLEKIPEKCPTGDSSGCSSGQESISSSVESNTHLSIDSGTDQPRNVTEDNKENSLRLRNVSSKGYVLHDPTPPINRGTKPTFTPSGNYCVLGVDLSTKPTQETPYVSISDVETATSPYISNKPPSAQPAYTDFFKTPNPGYVPFSHPEPASKNTGYVVAGDLSSPSVENKAKFAVVEETPVAGKPATVWQQPPVQPSLTKSGYVTVGDAPPPVTVKEINKGYVPQRQFEAKSLKED